MKRGHLSQYFSGLASKTLSNVETNANASHQHEFNGVNDLIGILGRESGQAVRFPANFVYLADDSETNVSTECHVSWYDSRRNHPTRSEYRLYFPSNEVMDRANEGDLLVVGRQQDASLCIVVVEVNSTAENQIRWLFGFDEQQTRYAVKSEIDTDAVELDLSSKFLLEQLGFESDENEPDYLEEMLSRFGGAFPSTMIFSKYARETIPDVSSIDDPDAAIVAWLEREELLFKTLERHIVSQRLETGFADDVDSFVAFSLSVHNRRKSRAGFALENHLEALFKEQQVAYSREQVTENRAKPDFLFPGIDAYRDETFPADSLTMLGVKQTCKDRWRQVLSEAHRVNEKHLLTFEPSISCNQTDEMRSHGLQLVVPRVVHRSYRSEQQNWLMSLSEFLDLIRERNR
jgi:hypothetical protein